MDENRMNSNDMIGRALAVIEVEAESNHTVASLPSSLVEYVQHLKQVREELLDDGRAAQILTDIPIPCCQNKKALLDGNERYFVARFAIERDDTDDSKPCRSLATHLNNCYRCFNSFTDVLRHFCLMKDELS